MKNYMKRYREQHKQDKPCGCHEVKKQVVKKPRTCDVVQQKLLNGDKLNVTESYHLSICQFCWRFRERNRYGKPTKKPIEGCKIWG